MPIFEYGCADRGKTSEFLEGIKEDLIFHPLSDIIVSVCDMLMVVL